MAIVEWKWRIYESNQVDVKLYQYLKSCARTKDMIVKAIEAFYLPTALKHANASPLEIHKAYQQSIDSLLSMAKILSIEAKATLNIDIEIDSRAPLTSMQASNLDINSNRLPRFTQEERLTPTAQQELAVEDGGLEDEIYFDDSDTIDYRVNE
jgi:hypothetical protein